MGNSPQISICIPTYNRSGFLLNLLDSIALEVVRLTTSCPELAQSIEVCISDNASTDSTEADVRSWSAAHRIALRLQRQPSNVGPDRNYLAAAALAEGKYIWLMGSDDALREGSLLRILEAIKPKPTIVLGNRMNCSFEMQPQHRVQWLRIDGDRDFDFRQDGELVEYLRAATSLGAVFSYLSSVVVEREAWHSAETDEAYIGSAYVHVQKLILLLGRGAKLRYLHEPIVNNRGDNDSFSEAGAVNRVLIDLRGYTRLSRLLATDPRAEQALLGVLASERPPLHTAFYLRRNGTDAQWEEGRHLLRQYGAHPALLLLLHRCPALPRWLGRPLIQRWARRRWRRGHLARRRTR